MGKKAVLCLMHLLSVAFTVLLLAAAVVCWRASFVSPERGGFWITAAMSLPVVLLLNTAALVWWLLRRRWLVALLPLAALLFNMGYIAAMVQLPDFHDAAPHDLRVATLNANGFRRQGHVAVSARAIAALAEREQIDVLCLQEFVDERDYPADSITALFAGRMPYAVRDEGQAMLSRYPILRHRYVQFPETDNDYLWADLLLGDDTVRVFSLHLQTSGISSLRHRFRRDYNRNAPVEQVVGTLEHNSRIRARQVDEIRAAIDSTQGPVIVAGDFNDTPSSYVYRRVLGEMTDGFRAAGNGYGGTFRYLGGVLRIDYIFYDGNFRSTKYYMPAEDVSDHRMVVADLDFRP